MDMLFELPELSYQTVEIALRQSVTLFLCMYTTQRFEVLVGLLVSLFSSNVHSRITKYKNTNYMSHVTHKCLRDQ